MGSQSSGRSEIDPVSSGRDVVAGKQRSSAQFEVWNDSSSRGEVPLQVQRIETHSVGCVSRLEHDKRRNRIQRVLESAFQEAWTVGPGKNPSITQAQVPHSGVRCTAGHGVPAAGPKLDLVAAVLYPGLGPGRPSTNQQSTDQQDYRERFLHEALGLGDRAVRLV